MSDSKKETKILLPDLGFQIPKPSILSALETKGYTSSKPPQITIKPEPKKP